MSKWRTFFLSFLLFFSVSQASDRIPLWENLFYRIGQNSLGTFTYAYGSHLALGIGSTYAMVESGIDWKWNRFCVRHETLSLWASLPGGLVGTFAPVALPLALYLGSDDKEIQLAGIAMGQAALLAFGTTTVIKAFTGRTPPHVLDAIDKDPKYQKDYSDKFRFGFVRGSLIDGWPSGHTATAVAMATTLITLYPDNSWILAGGILYSATIGISMSFIAHWASDIFAGMLTGIAIGRTVGKSFAALQNKQAQSKVSFLITPSFAGINVKF